MRPRSATTGTATFNSRRAAGTTRMPGAGDDRAASAGRTRGAAVDINQARAGIILDLRVCP
jgi:hypothetical protein